MGDVLIIIACILFIPALMLIAHLVSKNDEKQVKNTNGTVQVSCDYGTKIANSFKYGEKNIFGNYDVIVKVINGTCKDIKYLSVNIKAINAVGDVIAENTMQITGPIKQGSIEKYTSVAFFSDPNDLIKSIRKGRVQVTYMYGGTETI